MSAQEVLACLAMPLVYQPNRSEFFLWGETSAAAPVATLIELGAPALANVVTPGGRTHIEGRALPLFDTLAELAVVPAADVPALPASIASWTLASKLALDLTSRERIVPTVVRANGRIRARWAAALQASEDAGRVDDIARSMPPGAHAVPAPAGRARSVWAPEALLRAFLDAAVDPLVRAARGAPAAPAAAIPPHATARKRKASAEADDEHTPWEDRWLAALEGRDDAFEPQGFAERTLIDDLDAWSRPLLGARDRLRACFRLELPADGDDFVLRFLLQSPDDPSLLVDAADVWRAKGRTLARLDRAFRDPQESLLEALGRAARLFPPLADSLGEARPERLELTPATTWSFLNEGAPALGEAGFGVILPAELTAAGQRRLRLRMKIGATTKTAGAVAGAAGFGLEEMLSFDWEAALGEHALSKRELDALARAKAPLVRHRGQWIVVDPRELARVRERVAGSEGRLRAADALATALSGEAAADGLHVAVAARGSFAAMLERLRNPVRADRRSPESLHGELRPYQSRGFAWLAAMAELGLGACLADDMGLGKTIQLLAFLLERRERAPRDRRPALLVAPTSVLGNWEREIERFAPSLEAVPHYGPDRARNAEDIPRRRGTFVLTSYGLLRRDLDLLSRVEWSTVALDEAQNIKNSASATARAARALRAAHRFALTGTPVENRLAELWSIFEFLNPGLLGPLETFRREYAVPIERYGNDRAAARLKRIVGPFLLRRVKSDPAIIDDLPPKHEMNVVCTLTREQVTLYQAVVDEEMRRIESAEGIERRGRVLALLSFLKQVCNHPAQYLGEPGPLARRSGKLERVTEMLEEALEAGDKALVFTQFREMGDRLEQHFTARLGVETLFLHGGTPKRKRDEMVRRFQELPRGPRVFVLSVKAGGTGLNLTAASHVFHFDRWWNPAVEDQATDRAYRIGQRRAVQVHKLICAGTVEEKIDALLEQKRGLADRIVGAGEQWITELGNRDLRELFSLAGHAPDDDEPVGDEIPEGEA